MATKSQSKKVVNGDAVKGPKKSRVQLVLKQRVLRDTPYGYRALHCHF